MTYGCWGTPGQPRGRLKIRSFGEVWHASRQNPPNYRLDSKMSDSVSSTAAVSGPDLAFSEVPASVPSSTPSAEANISSLLDSLDEAASESGQSLAAQRANAHENKLVQVRLGIASGLHAALRAKNPSTASHCLRVALGCSSWAAAMDLDDHTRDEVEVAALLHDV